MSQKMRCITAGAAMVLFALRAGADDSAASVALGGIQLKHERRISMEKERLTIAMSKVTVEYEFLNNSDRDITTEIAFPIPAYEASHVDKTFPFDDFKLWVDGSEVKYDIDAKAFLDKRDVSALLNEYKIDIATLGHSLNDKNDCSPDLERLSPEVRKQLIREGLFEGIDDNGCGGLPVWKVQKYYHWKQTFPAHRLLHVRHEYTPAFGFQVLGSDGLKSSVEDDPDGRTINVMKDGCFDPSTAKTIVSGFEPQPSGEASWGALSWVDFILTTANNWQTPIKNFELVIDRGPQEHNGYEEDWNYASVCWNGPVKRIDADHYVASAKDFVPKKELRVVFLTMPVANTVAPATSVVTKRSAGACYGWIACGGAAVVGFGAAGFAWRRKRQVHGG